MVKLSNEEILLVNALEKATGTHANDVIAMENSIVFLVKKGELGKAIGKRGANLKRLEQSLGRNVDLVEDSNEAMGLLANFFHGIVFQGIEEKNVGGKKTIVLKVNSNQKGLAIGRKGERINCARTLLRRRFAIDKLRIL